MSVRIILSVVYVLGFDVICDLSQSVHLVAQVAEPLTVLVFLRFQLRACVHSVIQCLSELPILVLQTLVVQQKGHILLLDSFEILSYLLSLSPGFLHFTSENLNRPLFALQEVFQIMRFLYFLCQLIHHSATLFESHLYSHLCQVFSLFVDGLNQPSVFECPLLQLVLKASYQRVFKLLLVLDSKLSRV